jgi:hypothetical protein
MNITTAEQKQLEKEYNYHNTTLHYTSLNFHVVEVHLTDAAHVHIARSLLLRHFTPPAKRRKEVHGVLRIPARIPQRELGF